MNKSDLPKDDNTLNGIEVNENNNSVDKSKNDMAEDKCIKENIKEKDNIEFIDDEERRIFAEWQGLNCRFGEFNACKNQDDLSEKQKVKVKINQLKKRKILFVLSFIGLLADFALGIGCFIGLIVGIISSVEFSKLYKEEKRFSSQLFWAMIIGYLGFIIGGIFLFLII